MVRSGETGGSLDTTLIALADMIEREVRLRGKIKSAMTYPVAIVALVILIMSAMLLFVVPQFESIFSQLGGTLPLPTRGLMWLSDAFKSYWYVFVGGAIAARFFFRRYKRTEQGREVVDSIKLRAPVFGTLFHKTALSTVLEHARDADEGRRADPPGARDRERHGQQQGDRQGHHRGADLGARRRIDREAPARSTRSSPRWSCR